METALTGPVLDFVSTDQSTDLRITVTREPDGKYYVTDVSVR